jgi:N4-gp56 family major capsid protein
MVAAYKQNLVLANVVNKMPMKGKKGDTLHIPKPTRGSASAKSAETQVTLISATESEVVVNINRHFEYSRLIEDITDVQALSSMRRFYTEDAGYALAKQVDDDLLLLGTGFGNGTVAAGAPADWVHTNSFYIDPTNGLTAYAQDTVAATDIFSDLGLRQAIKELDDNDTPMDRRSLIIPPSVRQTIMGIDRYVSSDFVDGRGVVNGKIGELYGVDIYVSTNCPEIESAGENAGGSIQVKAALLLHRDAIVFAEQMGVRAQTQYKQEYLGDLFTADTLYGKNVLRPESGIVLAVPA